MSRAEATLQAAAWSASPTESGQGEEPDALEAFRELKEALNAGHRARRRAGADGRWHANAWVKAGILLGFRLGRMGPAAPGGPFPFYDKDTYPLRAIGPERWRPGGARRARRSGTAATSRAGVVCMPPMYINVGAYVDEGTMVDSHALVGSCAQIGKRVHLSARRPRSAGCWSRRARCR